MSRALRSLPLVVALSLAAAFAPACDFVVEVETLDSLDGVELVYEEEGDMVIPRRADGEPLVMVQSGPRAQVLYLALDGVTIQRGDWSQHNAQESVSFIPQQAVSQVPPFDHTPWGADRAAVIAGLVDGLRQDFAGYQVTVTTARPASGPYTMVVMGGRAEDIGRSGAAGIAPLDQGNWNQSDVAFTFTATLAAYGYDLRHVAWTAAHEIAHSLGLQHIEPGDAIMHPVVQHHALRWTEGAISGGGGFQRDHDVLGGVLARAGAPAGCGVLSPGQTLGEGQGLTSCDGRFQLVMQTDGNLVLYQAGVGAIWHSVTFNTDGDRAVMQTDGNLVVYGPSGALFHTGTWGNPGAFLAVQDDGNLVVYSAGGAPLWASGTDGR